MANYGTTTSHRPLPTTPLPPPPPTSAAVRIVRNLEKFSLYYAIFVWTVLFITLIPRRKVSVVYLVAMTEVTVLYFLLLRALPDSVVLHKIIDKRFVLFLLFVITCLELILTQAGLHLVIVLAATVPIVVIHALLSKSDDVLVQEGGEIARLVQEKLSDHINAQPENLV